ncbi:hypothetical protein GGI15_001339 [Coemansia interrupta]|uniref:BED-type domain-containing protein n=1 Tax=Coemansia interrupta TaxID=1126814 RepID=A0A9W8LN16_9FUNG|nr:hypothetical protein GGI15_001339 [Coemansia interrupta]
MGERMHNNGQLAAGHPQQQQTHTSYHMGAGDAVIRPLGDEQSARTNKVSSLLHVQSPGESHSQTQSPIHHSHQQAQAQPQPQQRLAGDGAAESNGNSSSNSHSNAVGAAQDHLRGTGSPQFGSETPRQQAAYARSAGHPNAPAGSQPPAAAGAASFGSPYVSSALRRTRPHAATISEPMMSPPQSAMQARDGSGQPSQQQQQQQHTFRFFRQQPPAQGFEARVSQHPSHGQQQQQQQQQASHDQRPRRLSFVGSQMGAEPHRDHYETSFRRSTAVGSSFYGGARQPMYAQQPQPQQRLPMPASAPSHQQHFNHHSPVHQHQQQQQQRMQGAPGYGAYGGASQQRSLSPPALGRRQFPGGGRFEPASGGAAPGRQALPVPFPRIPSPIRAPTTMAGAAPAVPATAPPANASVNASSQSPARESTRRLSSVVWGPTGFERLESGMSRCRMCGKEYSRGSSTGTLKRHFKQHQANLPLVGSAGSAGNAPYARTSPPATARPRAYSHRVDMRATKRETSPFGASSHGQQMPPPHVQQQQQQQMHGLRLPQIQQPYGGPGPAYAYAAPPQQQQPQQQMPAQPPMQPKAEQPGALITPHTSGSSVAAAAFGRSSSDGVPADVDSSSAIAGSALLSMAAGGDRPPVRRAGRLSDPSVYALQQPPADDEACDISVSSTPSMSPHSPGAAHVLRNGNGNGERVTLPPLRHVSRMDVDEDAMLPPMKRARRATVAGVQSVVEDEGLPEQLGAELDALLPSQLVALSSELVRRVAGVLPALAVEAAGQAANAGAEAADPIDVLVGHIRRTLLDGEGAKSPAHPQGAFAAGKENPASSSSSAFASSILSSFLFSAPAHSAQTPISSCALPFTIRKLQPLSSPISPLSPMLSRVSAAMQRIAPLSLAEHAWDNVGILLEAAKPREMADKVFLTIDLTSATLDEALNDPSVGVIVAYHPPIFTAWKSLSMGNLKQSLVLRCAAAGVSIYSPHTSLDSCANGINDWLASLVGPGNVTPITPADPAITSTAEGQQNAGSGRLVELTPARPLSDIIADVKSRLALDHIRVARAPRHLGDRELVERIAICAGAGYSVVSPVDADLYLTGEMGHHDILAAVAKNTSCILGEHSNTERGYLVEVLKPRLQEVLDEDACDESIGIVVSQNDRDPIVIE